MTAYERFKNQPIAHAAIGLEQSDIDVTYYCTPKGSNIIGWAGADGIHYCTIGGFGDMIFAVSPMNFGDCVHPIARNFEDLLRMLLLCGDMAALEQCYDWDEEQFKAFLIDCPVTGKQTEVLNVIREEFGLEPMEDAFSYIKKLQAEFDLRKIPYTEDYYDPDMNAAAPASVQWNVNFEGNCPEDCCPCTERPIGKVFSWGDERWHIPAVYSCAKGLVIDFCVEIDPGKTAAWIRKWDLTNEESHKYTPEEQRQIEEENPLKIGFRPILLADNEKLRPERSSSKCWIPPCCLDGADQNQAQTRLFLEHYGLDESRCWAFHRTSFPWGTNEPPVPASLTLHLEREMAEIPVTRFDTPAVGETIVFSHPVTGVTHTLTVEAFEPQTMDLSRMRDDVMEFPTHYHLLTYSLQPEIPAQTLRLQDCVQSDAPRFRQTDFSNQVTVNGSSACIGIIGGSDGPTAVFFTHSNLPKPHCACSSMHFAPVQDVTWQLMIYEKKLPDTDIPLF